MELSCGALLGGSFKKQNDDSTPAKKTKKQVTYSDQMSYGQQNLSQQEIEQDELESGQKLLNQRQ